LVQTGLNRRYGVWFDSRLLPGDTFRQVITDKIDAAKAVIVIWTPSALKSKGVRAEALRAFDHDKLICVRTAEVAPRDIQLPFNALELSLVTDRLKIYDALTQLGVHPEIGKALVLPKGERDAGEAAMAWGHIKDLTDVELFEEFYKHYGEGHAFYRKLAEKRIAEFKGSGRAAPRPSATAAPIQLPKAEDVFLRIEAGMHTAKIWRISLTADGRLMATASDDKTVRLWSLPDGKLVRTLRPPIGPGNDGMVYAVALAPDGRWEAAAGWFDTRGDEFVYIFDASTGSVLTRLGPLPNAVNDLAVSPNGALLAAGLVSTGVRVWETNGWRPTAEYPEFGDRVMGLSYAADCRLAATSFDGYVRLYGPDGRLAKKARVPGGERPVGVAFSPDGFQLAVGYEDSPRVDVLSGQTLTHLFSPDFSGLDNGGLSSVAWLADGTHLAAAGRLWVKGNCPVFVWSMRGKGARRELSGSADTIMDLEASDRDFAFGAQDPAFGLLSPGGGATLLRGPPKAHLRNLLRERFVVSPDGRRARFTLRNDGRNSWLFDLIGPSFAAAFAVPSDMRSADILSLDIADWEDTTEPKLGGKMLVLAAYEMARSLAIAPDAQSFVLGTEWSLRRFDKDGKQLWEKQVPGVAWGVNLAREGRLILAAYGDGTIRWYRAVDGEELLALFIHVPEDPKADKRWVLWTPEGYYTASSGGEDLIGWHVNRGLDQAADFYPAETFRSTFHKPDIVLKALDKVDAPA
jgi:hypothetical protein